MLPSINQTHQEARACCMRPCNPNTPHMQWTLAELPEIFWPLTDAHGRAEAERAACSRICHETLLLLPVGSHGDEVQLHSVMQGHGLHHQCTWINQALHQSPASVECRPRDIIITVQAANDIKGSLLHWWRRGQPHHVQQELELVPATSKNPALHSTPRSRSRSRINVLLTTEAIPML